MFGKIFSLKSLRVDLPLALKSNHTQERKVKAKPHMLLYLVHANEITRHVHIRALYFLKALYEQ